ncbi:hypothetical protein GONAM_15_01160 [Gordonia namibiensis NBRC 108229]|uniref:Uncharacterized protein n=1 Tax=Gordonia namibiensis NBRC 108229 TaxID=1208314 RepID=K6X7R3_9ACTN|nr:hypothetical protein [Gordonia namibiensis]GAC00408.1 hypothetical protein GONAM_15_01160 [Gordonia namibiensis NBRC 108229]
MTTDEYLALQSETTDATVEAYTRFKRNGDGGARALFWELANEFWNRKAQWGHHVGLG